MARFCHFGREAVEPKSVRVMLNRTQPSATESSGLLGWSRDSDFLSLVDIKFFLNRYLVFITTFVLVAVAGSAFYTATSDPSYTARTQILIEPKLPQTLQLQTSEISLSLDTSQVETQLAVLRSEKIAMLVIDDLDLTANPDFWARGNLTIGDRVMRLVRLLQMLLGLEDVFDGPFPDRPQHNDVAGASEFERLRRAVEIFGESLQVQRLGVSYAIDIRFNSSDPELSAHSQALTGTADRPERVRVRKRGYCGDAAGCSMLLMLPQQKHCER
jgi:uncharacterized protein involved in exopolysaccharide biosynthesis